MEKYTETELADVPGQHPDLDAIEQALQNHLLSISKTAKNRKCIELWIRKLAHTLYIRLLSL